MIIKIQSARKLFSPVPLRFCIAAISLGLASGAPAAPGDISDVPLYARGGAEPNIMFVLDSSRSMTHIAIPEAYDEETTYVDCPDPANGDGPVTVFIPGPDAGLAGQVKFKVGDGFLLRWAEKDNFCFANNQIYEAVLGVTDWLGNYVSVNTPPRAYTGNFLNWYFSREAAGGGREADIFKEGDEVLTHKKGTEQLTDVMKGAATSLISDLQGVRVGLMQYNDYKSEGDCGDDCKPYGGKILYGLASVTDDSKATLLNSVGNISADGDTPLGTTFEDVGRYFITGYEEQMLTFEKESGDGELVTESMQGQLLFKNEPVWGSVQKPGIGTDSAIQHYCQKNFMVALTDGIPFEDKGVSASLANYDHTCADNKKGCTVGDNASMDDVIKALYDLDLRPDLIEPDGTPVKNNIISYVIGFADKTLSSSDLMVNAADLGSGGAEGVYTASDAESLAATFNRIVNKVRAIQGSSSSLAFNTSSLQAGSKLYAARFDSGDWSGDLSAFAFDTDGALAETASWSASEKLDARAPESRVMITSSNGAGVPFTADPDQWGNDLKDDLKVNTSSGAYVVDGRIADRVNYLRGDRSKEGTENTKFRQRGGRLGDIVNSSPVYVGAPNASWGKALFDEAASYEAFRAIKSDRTPVVYVGANDGFLHGFDAHSGEEVIAYTPEALLSRWRTKGLHALSSQLYSHNYYVDGPLSVTDAYIGNSWKTVLVGGLGAGGKGYFALDITDPDSFSQQSANSIFMWEFTDSDSDPDSDSDSENLGFSFSRAQIGRMPNGKWAAVFGNGYNSETGDAGLFIRYLDGTGGEYLSTGKGSAGDKNGLSTPAIVDADRDGTIDRVYAGDLKGNMWAFDVSDKDDPDSWDVAYDGKPLLSVGEPITGGPRVARNTAYIGGGSPNLLVTFGTGQYLADADTADITAGGFYAVSDNGTGDLDEGDLQVRTIDDDTDPGLRTLSGLEFAWGQGPGQKSGWYIQLDEGVGQDGGERVITTPDLLRNTLFFNTMIPTGQVCFAGAYGWLMAVDVHTGLAPADRGVFDANGDTMINMTDQGFVGSLLIGGSPNKSGFIGDGSGGIKQLTPDSSGGINIRDVDPGAGARVGRLAWEEATPM